MKKFKFDNPEHEFVPCSTGVRLNIDGDEYILAQVAMDVVAAISLTDGNRYSEMVKVKDVHSITERELSEILANEPYTIL
jgi:hypothetical protein